MQHLPFNTARSAARIVSTLLLGLSALVGGNAFAIDEYFDKPGPGGMGGFLVPTDPTYIKECKGCHFLYSPGMLPAASWTRMMGRVDKHFGEDLRLAADTRDAVTRYLVDNAADKSAYLGSEIFMLRVNPNNPPWRIQNVPRIRTSHRVMEEVIARNNRSRVRNFVNCDGCHQAAAKGDFSLQEIDVQLIGINNYKLKGSPGKSIAD
ncbi:MAG: cytochrome C [Betaproteobacteria bacterium]|nr:cytochrome C [Betaproteobacteria bacterium]